MFNSTSIIIKWLQYNGSLTAMPFLVDELPTSIAILGPTPIVSTHRGLRQDRSVILQLGLANIVVKIDRHKLFITVAHLNITFLQQSLKVVMKQRVEKLDVGWILDETNSGEDVLFFCRLYCDRKESSKLAAGCKEVVSGLLCIR